MPELPEVQTTVNGLKKTVVGLTISAVWTDLARKNINRPDYKDSIKYLPFFEQFKKSVHGAKIVSAERRAKNILINLSNEKTLKHDGSCSGKTILIHMKMTGHLMYGTYIKRSKAESVKSKVEYWEPSPKEKNGALRDPFNRFLHFVITFTNGKSLVLSDVRKFAKVTLLSTVDAHATKPARLNGFSRSGRHLDNLGPEPLEKHFDFKQFSECINRKPKGKIKSVLMDQSILSGVGNIYSDEALWLAGVHPLSVVAKIPHEKALALFHAVQSVLKKGIDFRGDSTSDYRQIDGTRGDFSHEHNAYRLAKTPCKKRGCSGTIHRIVVGGRSAHFCPVHQKEY